VWQKGEVYGNPAFQVWVGKQAKHGQVMEYDAEYFDLHHELFPQAVSDQIEFLNRASKIRE
jgi:hypothetical protein